MNAVDDFLRHHHQAATWALCGALEVIDPDPEHIVGRDEQGNEITNYAEHVDDHVDSPLRW